MNEIDLPPLSQLGIPEPGLCEKVQLYLAVWDDLTPLQKEVVNAHVRSCARCTAEQQRMRQATFLVGHMTQSSPSTRVDQAVMAAIAARTNSKPVSLQKRRPRSSRATPMRLVAALSGLAAVLVLALLAVHFTIFGSPTQFALPQNLTWSNYVLYHTETHVNAQGEHYQVNTYRDLSNGHVHVETIMGGTLHVVAVGDEKEMLGMDEMHHVAQWGAQVWADDDNDTNFDLAKLRSDLQAGRASYLGKDRYAGKDVYRVRLASGYILLLDMQYMPVNVLQQAGVPMYNQLQLLHPSQVSDSMWDMQVPAGFQMGTLPPKP